MRGRNLALFAGALGVGGWLALRLYREATAYNFEGKNVLITGGSRGLGLVMARQLVEAGGRVVICARDREELVRAHRYLTEHGGSVLSIRCDVTDQTQVAEMVALIRERMGPVDVLINNAGTIAVGPLQTMTLDDFEQAMNTNFWAAVYTTLAVLPDMRSRRQGRIVNISSIGGKIAVPHLLPYSASKFALTGLSEGLRAELARENVVVTTVCPGLMRTGSPRNAHFKGQHREEYAWFSISDALPMTSMSAETAARKILSACRRGDGEVLLSLSTKFAVFFHGLFPGLTTDLMTMVNKLLPGPGGIGTGSALGKDSESVLVPSWLTALSEHAARRYNQISSGGGSEDEGKKQGNGHS